MITAQQLPSVKQAAHDYIRRGFAIVPVPRGGKKPARTGWQKGGCTENDIEDTDNVGILCGALSGNLVDVDADCQEAIDAARKFLPPTKMIHGRASNRYSHHWYVADMELPTKRYEDVDGEMLIEYRTSGSQTLVPPSIHPSGEVYAWECDGEPEQVDAYELKGIVANIAATALLARHWPSEGSRHQCALAVAGMLLRGRMDADTVADIVACAAEIAGDEEAEGRRRDVETTAERLANGENVTGGPKLSELLDEKVVTRLRDWLGLRKERTIAIQGDTEQMRLTTSQPGMAPELEFTDTGNALRLAHNYSHCLKYVPQWGWLAYEGGRWVRDAEGVAMQYAKECMKAMLHEAADCPDRIRQGELLDHAKKSLSSFKLLAMLKLAQSEPGIVARIEEFDADPMLLNMLNGTLDLRTGYMRPHNPHDKLTKLAYVEYDPHAQAPRFQQFLAEVFREDTNLIAYVQRAFGYSLTGVTREQVFFTCFGSGANGKSTLLGAMMRILGDYAKPLKADALMSNRFGSNGNGPDPAIAALVGARLVTAQEPKGGELDTAKVKELTGGDSIQVRETHKMPFTFLPQFKLWLSTNERPQVPETTVGIWRRIQLIPFTVNFEGCKDETLSEKLAAEAPGILNWLIAGCRAWQRDGLGASEAVNEATREYRESEDPYLEFFETMLVRAPSDNRVELKRAYEVFMHWQNQAGAPPLSNKAFPREAERRGYIKKASNGKRWLFGCRVNTSVESGGNGLFVVNLSHEDVIEGFTNPPPTSTLPTLPDALPADGIPF